MWAPMAGLMEARGWRCETPTLFHHLRMIGAAPDALTGLTLGDYVRAADDYARTLRDEDHAAPIVIGHGLGGLIAQKLVERGSAGAGVFLAPFMPAGHGPAFRSLAIAYANILLTPASERRNAAVKPWRQGAAMGLFTGVDKSQREAVLDRLRHEPGRLFNDLVDLEREVTGAGRIDITACSVPTLTIAGGRDQLTPARLIARLGEAYARADCPGDYREYPAFGHWMAAGAGMPRFVQDLEDWLAARVVGASRSVSTS